MVRPFVPSKPRSARFAVPGSLPACWSLLFVPRRTVLSRSSPCSVMLLFFETCMISWYVPAAIVMRAAAVLLAGSASVAPCTVQNGPLPSSATRKLDRSVGAAFAVEERQADHGGDPPLGAMLKAAPSDRRIAPASTVT